MLILCLGIWFFTKSDLLFELLSSIWNNWTTSSLSVLGSICIFLKFYRDNQKDFSFRLLVFLIVPNLFNAFWKHPWRHQIFQFWIESYNRTKSIFWFRQTVCKQEFHLSYSQASLFLVDIPGNVESLITLSRESGFLIL